MKNEEPNVTPFSGLTDEQLEKQKKATMESGMHWRNDILNRLDRGDEIINVYGAPLRWKGGRKLDLVKCTSMSCALCNLFRGDALDIHCKLCPLYIVTQKSCSDSSSPWSNFANNPTKDSAVKMIEALRSTYTQLINEIQFREAYTNVASSTKAGYRVLSRHLPLPEAYSLEEAKKHAAKLRQAMPGIPVIEILKIVEVSRPELKYKPKAIPAPITGSWIQEEIDTLIKYADAFICETQARLGRTSSSVAYKLVSYLVSEGVELSSIKPLKNKTRR